MAKVEDVVTIRRARPAGIYRADLIERGHLLLDQVRRGDVTIEGGLAAAASLLDDLADQCKLFRLRALPVELRREAAKLRAVGPRLPFGAPPEA
jgi:hypothetical protein